MAGQGSGRLEGRRIVVTGAARGMGLATGGDPGHAPARRTYERAGFTGCPQVWYAKRL